jgi:GT2 family glycosyltransferase
VIDEVALGVFTHRTTYLPGLLGSLRKIGDPSVGPSTSSGGASGGAPSCVVVCADGPINANMARLWEAFQRTRARYWVFLDDDIEFLGGDVLGDCVRAMVRHRWAGCSIYSTFDPDHKLRDYEPWRRELLEQGVIEERDAGWMTGYFMLVDRDQVGDIGPDMNVPDPCTAIDTSYSVAIRARGLRLGLVPHVCYHTKKEVWAHKDIIHKVERYLLAKWGMFYWDCVQYTGCVLQWPGAANWRREQPECLETGHSV